jgi:hypothetical protein
VRTPDPKKVKIAVRWAGPHDVLHAVPDLTEPLVGTSEAHRNLAFTRLQDAKLLSVNRDTAGALLVLDAHPLLREYFAGEPSRAASRHLARRPTVAGDLGRVI